MFSVSCFVDRCLSFSFGHFVVCFLRFTILITPLVSSNSSFWSFYVNEICLTLTEKYSHIVNQNIIYSMSRLSVTNSRCILTRNVLT